jgi:hypothetical protein
MEGDVEAILVFLRNTGFGPEMNVTAIDPKTNKSFTTQVMLDELNIIKGQEPNEDGTFITTLPRSNSSVKLKPLTYGEIMELRRFKENYPKGRVVPSITWRLGKEIIELDGETDKGKIAKSLEIMPIADSKYIRNFLNNNEPRLDMTRVVTTPSGEKLTVNVGFGVEFFRPFFGL